MKTNEAKKMHIQNGKLKTKQKPHFCQFNKQLLVVIINKQTKNKTYSYKYSFLILFQQRKLNRKANKDIRTSKQHKSFIFILLVLTVNIKNLSIHLMQDVTYSIIKKQQKRLSRQIYYKMSFADDPQSNQIRKYKYNSESIQPWLYFFKLLALKPCDKSHRNKLVLNIPDTIVFNDKDNPVMWFFTNAKGEVTRLDNVPYYTITDKFMENALEKELVAVLKKPSYGYGGAAGNDVKVVSACQIKTVLSSVLGSRSQPSVIQRFVKTSSVKASVMRTCWRRNNCHEGWIITSNFEYTSKAKVNQISKFIVNTKHPNTYTATKCTSANYLNQTLKYVKNIVKFVEGYLPGTKFDEMVCDFIKDEGGNWWYINTKAFILNKDGLDEHKQIIIDYKPISSHDCGVELDQSQKKKLQSYTKCKKCKYCYKVVAEHLMTHTLTLMMILQCDQNLIKMGKQYPWLDRCYSQHVGSVNLYVQHKVCDSCYKFYKQVEKLVNLQNELARLSGIQVSEDNKNVVSITSVPYFKGHPPQFGSRLQKVKYDTEMPNGWNLPENEQIKVQLNINKSVYKRCRFMIFVHGIRDIPKTILDRNSSFSITYQFLQQSVRYKLNFNDEASIKPNVQNSELFNIQLQKMKIIYFFIENRQEIKQFLKEQGTLKVILWQDQQVLGKLEMQLEDFKSDKVLKRDYFKMFSGKNIFPYLSWGLFATLGLHEGPSIQTSSLKLSKKDGLFFPQSDYNGPDPLPEDWVQMIQERNDKESFSPTQSRSKNQKTSNQTPSLTNNFMLKNSLDQEILKYSRESNTKKKDMLAGSMPLNSSKVKRKPYY